MAIRDRVTIRTIDGSVLDMVVDTAGGKIDRPQGFPTKGAYTVTMMNKNDDPTGEYIAVPVGNVASVHFDQAEKPKKAKG